MIPKIWVREERESFCAFLSKKSSVCELRSVQYDLATLLNHNCAVGIIFKPLLMVCLIFEL